MQKQIMSTIAHIPRPESLNTQIIEELLQKRYGELIRWAIIDSDANELKISITYEKDA